MYSTQMDKNLRPVFMSTNSLISVCKDIIKKKKSKMINLKEKFTACLQW